MSNKDFGDATFLEEDTRNAIFAEEDSGNTTFVEEDSGNATFIQEDTSRDRKVSQKVREKAERDLREDIRCREREDAERVAIEEAKKKAEDKALSERKQYYQVILESVPFRKFPNIQKELIALNDLNEYYYRDKLEKLCNTCTSLSRWLNDEYVRQSNEYNHYASIVNRFLSQTQNIHCNEINAICQEGRTLEEKGRMMHNFVREEQEKASLNKLIKKRTIIAIIFTTAVIAAWCILLCLRIKNGGNYLEESSIFVQILFGVACMVAFLGIFIVFFVWTDDFRKKE